jgi:phosphate transport system permease protein
MIWLTSGALFICLAMIVGLAGLIGLVGSRTFWPVPVVLVETKGGERLLGEVTGREWFEPGPEALEELPTEVQAAARETMARQEGRAVRREIRIENFELTGKHTQWIEEYNELRTTLPEWVLVIERFKGGRFYGVPTAFEVDGAANATQPADVLRAFQREHPAVLERLARKHVLQEQRIGQISDALEKARLAVVRARLDYGHDSPQARRAQVDLESLEASSAREMTEIGEEVEQLNELNRSVAIRLATSLDLPDLPPAEGASPSGTVISLDQIVRAYPANRLDWLDRLGIYLSRWYEFLTAEPRESNLEGGVFPAIFGTVTMTLLMTVAVVPFGILAALFLREYARSGIVVSLVRIAINNLAGVPSIVFGVFGLGFFCYLVGGQIDEWFFPERLPSPTYGKGALIWASLTLALLTLPVVIVATEEALAAVPNSMREGSYACGASKWQTIRRIVLPRALPGVMTGAILAVARGAGEVAPLMLVGAAKLAPRLLVDGQFPFIHPERSFMHLGFHVFDLGFQSPNAEAARPMVFTSTLLLIAIVVILNLLGIRIRSKLRKRFAAGKF